VAYATVDDLQALCGETELIQLTDRSSPPADAIDLDVVNAALQTASDVVDSYVAAAYALPLPSTPAMLKDVTVDLARHRLYAGKASEEVQARYDEAMKRLRDIAKGVAKIPGVQGQEPPARTGMVASSAADRLFTHDRLRGF
jgi:phage gp36-like protein